MTRMALLVGIVALGTACTWASDPGGIGSTGRAALTHNQLTFHDLELTNLASAPLAQRRIDAAHIALRSDSDLVATTEGRTVLRYVAACALRPDDVLVAWDGSTSHHFPGRLGLAPAWEVAALGPGDRDLISACLIAHLNAFGVSVMISVRAPGFLLATPSELTEYPVYEGTFFGQVLDGSLEAFSCTGNDSLWTLAHSEDRQWRVCAETGSPCQVTVVGRCRDVCDEFTPEHGWQGCWAAGVRYAHTVSVYLRDQDVDQQNRVCMPGQACMASVLDGDAVIDCQQASSCAVVCTGAICTVEGSGATVISGRFTGRAAGELNCQDAAACTAECQGPETTCEIDCWSAGSCDGVTCTGGASCLLDCTGAGSCAFAACDGPVLACENGVLACNRPCP